MSEMNLAYGNGDTSYQAAGGFEGLQKLAAAFYCAMDVLPEARKIRAMHSSDLAESTDKLARFLSGWLGGPKLYRETYGSIAIPRAHAHLDIDEAARDAWLKCMEVALSKQPYQQSFKDYMLRELYTPAERSRIAAQKSQR
ncbi:Group 2 truncated hemoglobin YjbI [Sinobacterium norvegicum]|uniref:Group 2 truncated hemoglobin YjbI n=1 Tax=Sinobacterium norvegicum TaxID=1641715 RepID=A0ABM9AEJ9_9GAMM|nr:group II truncated hemoglobin [Sinobacterium norvegicum]CAH0991621.1 Group 2 truncated hemoglobin YjbI [Sinobacterium norvegicum]